MSQRQQTTRRTVLRTLGSLSTLTLATSAAAGARSDRTGRGDQQPEASTADDGCKVNQYIGVVDRIVDEEHVVILLEDDGELVDQHVAPRSELEDVDESDILLVVIKDDELLVAQQLPKRPGERMHENRDRRPTSDLAEDPS